MIEKNWFALLLGICLLMGCGKKDAQPNNLSPNQQITSAGSVPDISFPKVGLSARLTFLNGPTKVRVNAPFELAFWSTAQGNPENGPFIQPGFAIDSKSVKLQMTAMGHGADDVTVTLLVTDPARPEISTTFKVDHVLFNMKGEWEIQILLVKEGKMKDSASFKYFQK